jgi:D-alanyl-D-alanine carboxypeptidase/D-alanyl-D-alanine-endopeptidase (penicillin-binding protein 4)
VQHIVSVSDNEGAEVLLRQAAIATSRPSSFRGGVRTVRATLSDLGLNLAGASFSDGSGLARSDMLPIHLLLDVVQMAADPTHPELSSMMASLPVAGFSGSLAYRFLRTAQAGAGVVRAKTGTLSGVHGLAGVVTTSDGSALAFVGVADSAPPHRLLPAQSQLDRIAALLSTCGCSGS